MRTILTTEDLHQQLVKTVKRYGSQTVAARQLGFSLPFINDVLKKKRSISADLAYALGYEKVVMYVPRKPERRGRTARRPRCPGSTLWA